MLSALQNANKAVGIKQCSKAVENGFAQMAFLAEDAEETIKEPFASLCEAHQVQLQRVPTMKELGSVCGIEVGAAAAVLLK